MKKIIIIGAGPAGITAGYDLISKSSDYEVTIIEEAPVVGGLCARFENEGNVLDPGGHMFISNNSDVKKFWYSIIPAQGKPSSDDLALDRYCKIHNNGPDPESTEDVLLSREKVTRVYKDNKFYESPVYFNKEAVKNFGLATSIKSGFSQLGGNILKHKESSLEDYYVNRFGKQLYSMFLEDYLEKVWGKKPSRMGSAWGEISEKSLICPVISTDKKEKDYDKAPAPYANRYYYPKYGAFQMWEAAADRFIEKGGSIHKNCKVTGIETVGNKITGVRCYADGDEFEVACDYLISSMPIRDLVLGMENVEDRTRIAAEELDYRGLVSVCVELKEMTWKNDTEDHKSVDNIAPDSFVYITNPNVKVSRIQIYNNFSPYMVKDNGHFYLGLNYYCNEGDYYWSMNERDWKKAIVGDLTKLGLIKSEDSLISYNKIKFNKAFPSYDIGYENRDQLVKFLNGFENLYCIGRNGQHRFSAIDEVMKTSFEAVKNILNGVPKKDNVWNVNDLSDDNSDKLYNSALLSGEGEYRGNYVPIQKQINDKPEENKESVPIRRMRRAMMTPIKKADPDAKLSEPIVLDNSVVIAARPSKSIPFGETAEEKAAGKSVVNEGIGTTIPSVKEGMVKTVEAPASPVSSDTASNVSLSARSLSSSSTVASNPVIGTALRSRRIAEELERSKEENRIQQQLEKEQEEARLAAEKAMEEANKASEPEFDFNQNPDFIDNTVGLFDETPAFENASSQNDFAAVTQAENDSDAVFEENIQSEYEVAEESNKNAFESFEDMDEKFDAAELEENVEASEETVADIEEETVTENIEEAVVENNAEDAISEEIIDSEDNSSIEENVESDEFENSVTAESETTSTEEEYDEYEDPLDRELKELYKEFSKNKAPESVEEETSTVEEAVEAEEVAEAVGEPEEAIESSPEMPVYEEEIDPLDAALNELYSEFNHEKDSSSENAVEEAEEVIDEAAEETEEDVEEVTEEIEEAAEEVVEESSEEIADAEVEEIEEASEETADEVAGEFEETSEEVVDETADEVVEDTTEEDSIEVAEEIEETSEETVDEVVEEIEEAVEEDVTTEESSEAIEKEIESEVKSEVVAEESEKTSDNSKTESSKESQGESDSISLPGFGRGVFSRRTINKSNRTERVRDNKGKIRRDRSIINEVLVDESPVEDNENTNDIQTEINIQAETSNIAQAESASVIDDSIKAENIVQTENVEVTENAEATENVENENNNRDNGVRSGRKIFNFATVENFKNETDPEVLQKLHDEKVISREKVLANSIESDPVSFTRVETFDRDDIVDYTNPHERVITKEFIASVKADPNFKMVEEKRIRRPSEVEKEKAEKNEEYLEQLTKEVEINVAENAEVVEISSDESVDEELLNEVNATVIDDEEVVETSKENESEVVEETSEEESEVAEVITEEETFEEESEDSEVITEDETFEEESEANEVENETEEVVEEEFEELESDTAEEESSLEETEESESDEDNSDDTESESTEEEISEEAAEETFEDETESAEEELEETDETESEIVEESNEDTTEEVEFEEPTEEEYEEVVGDISEDEFESDAEEVEEAKEAAFDESEETIEEESEVLEEEAIEEASEVETVVEEVSEETEEASDELALQFEESSSNDIQEETIEETVTEQVDEFDAFANAIEESEKEEIDNLSKIDEQAASRSIVKKENKHGSLVSSDAEEKKEDRIVRGGFGANDLYGDKFALSYRNKYAAMEHELDDLDGGKKYETHYNRHSDSTIVKSEEPASTYEERKSDKDYGSMQIVKEARTSYDFTNPQTSGTNNIDLPDEDGLDFTFKDKSKLSQKTYRIFGDDPARKFASDYKETDNSVENNSSAKIEPEIIAEPEVKSVVKDEFIGEAKAPVVETVEAVTETPEVVAEVAEETVSSAENASNAAEANVPAKSAYEAKPNPFKSNIDTSIVFKNARVIKTTKITRGIEEEKKPVKEEKPERVYSDKQRVIAIIKNGEYIPVDDKKNEIEKVSESSIVTEDKNSSAEKAPAPAKGKKGKNKKNKKSKNKKEVMESEEEIMVPPISVMLDAKEAAEMTEPLESPISRQRNFKI